jgi:hypothetical protein
VSTPEDLHGAGKVNSGHRLLGRFPDWSILLCFCLIFSFEVVWTINQKSATFDEPLNLVSGYITLRYGDDRLVPQNLPLVKLLAAFPLLGLPSLKLPAPPQPWSDQAQFVYAYKLLYQLNDGDYLVLLGRLAMLPLSLILGCFIFVWTKQLFGHGAAILALLLYCFEPNILAHSGLITTDIATSCFMFLTAYGWYQLTQAITWPRIILPTLAFGLGLITKFTTLPLGLIFLMLSTVIIFSAQPLHLRLSGLPTNTIRSRIGKLVACSVLVIVSLSVAWGVIWTAYGFRAESTIAPVITYQASWEAILPSSPTLIQFVSWARDVALVPETYLYGLTFLLKISGHFLGFLNGELREGGWWHYFIVTFAIKTPLPLIGLLALALAVQRRLWRTHPVQAAFLFGPMVIYSVVITASKWNIGHRHLLPIYPFLFILAGSLVPWAMKRRLVMRIGLTGLVCWYVLASIIISPNYLAYFNELAGGPDRGYRYLVDSNLDWGQDLKGLRKYMDEHGIQRVWLSYFGQVDPHYYGISYDYLPSYHIFDPENVNPSVWEADRLPLLQGTVAISATLLQGAYLPFKDVSKLKQFYAEYRQLTPVAKIGYSIFIYQIE